MDQNRRFLLFLTLTAVLWFGWFGFVQPRFFAPPAPQKPPAVAELVEAEAADAEEAPADDAPQAALPDNPRRTVAIGSLAEDSGYYQQVTLTTRGAAVQAIELNDSRYKELTDRGKALKVVGSTPDPKFDTLESGVDVIDAQLERHKTNTIEIDWKLERTIPDEKGGTKGAVFSLRAPDGSVEVVKTYTLNRVDAVDERGRDATPKGYELGVTVTLRNLSDQPRPVAYTLQGPVGLPVENEEHTSKYRELELGFLDEEDGLMSAALTAGDAAEKAEAARAAAEARKKAEDAERALARVRQRVERLEAESKEKPDDKATTDALAKARADLDSLRAYAASTAAAAQDAGRGLEEWRTPFRYLGTEVQYFTALLFPRDDRPIAERYKNPIVASAEPQLVAEARDPNFNDVSFRLTSAAVTLPPDGEATHEYSLYAGPKRKELLQPLGADAVLDLGWFSVIGQAMLWLMEKLHSVGAPYWLAIIGLTVIVRACLFPLSRKQAIGAAKMKDLQPKLTELKTKFGNDHEKLFKAQSELFRKHGYGPLGPMASGCLPIFLQLPIFMGLYAALQNSIDLRQAEFLWIDNLAAPDELFRMPFSLPFLGADFNLLPFVTVALFYIQQKMFMPPATTPEQEAQYKIMNFMTLFMGVLFYHVPAGLCVYFISSSLWSIAERKLLGRTKAAHIGPAEAAEIDHEIEEMTGQAKPARGGKDAKGKAADAAPAKKTWLEKLFEAADEARRRSELGGDAGRPGAAPKSGPKPGRKSKSKR